MHRGSDLIGEFTSRSDLGAEPTLDLNICQVRNPSVYGVQVQFQRGQELAEVVMEFAGEMGALLFAQGFQAGGQGARPFPRLPEPLLRLFLFGDVLNKSLKQGNLSIGVPVGGSLAYTLV